MQIPDRTPLSEKTANTLEKSIRNGQWSHQLPGYRVLCEQLGVSPRTIRSALAILTRRTLLLPPERTKPRLINPNYVADEPTSSVKRQLHIVLNDALQEQEIAVRRITEKLRDYFARKGWEVLYEVCEKLSLDYSDTALETFRQNYEHHRWLLIQPPAELVEWCTNHLLPIICIGGEIGQHRPPFVTARLSDMIGASIRHLASLRHRRICVLMSLRTKEGRSNQEKHIKKVMGKLHMSYHAAYNFPVIHSHTPKDLWKTLDQLFAHSPPSALVTTHVQQLIAIYSYCHQRGLRIPEDLSVVVTQESRHLPWFTPAPAHFSLPVTQYVNKAKRWIEHYPIENVEVAYVSPKFHPGKSVKALPLK